MTFLAAALMLQAATGAEAIPPPFPSNRYDPMKATSPFALATPVAETAETPSFARNFFVASIARFGDTDIVTIMNQDKQPFTLMSGETTRDGITLVGVEYRDQIGRSEVTIKKGAEFATLKFNEQVLQAPPPVTAPGTVHVPALPVPGGTNRITPPVPQVQNPSAPGGQPPPRRRLIRRPSR